MNIKSKNWGEDRIIFDGLSTILFYLKDERFTQTLEKTYWRLDKESFTRDADREYVYKFYNESRQYEKSRLFISKLQKWQSENFEDPPILISNLENKSTPLLMNIQNSKEVALKKFPLKTYTGMIMVGSPHCGWSKRALKDISKKISKINRESIKVITPQEFLDTKEITKWNKIDKNIPYWPVYKESAFPKISFLSTPTFYFLKNGNIEHKFNGWPREGNIKSIKKGFNKIGIDF